MKILIISPRLKGIGGIAQHVRDLIKFLEENGHDVDIISSENTPIIPIKKLRNPSFLISSYFKAKFMKNYDIVHSQHPVGALAMKNVTGKKVLTIHGVYSEQIGILYGKTSSKFSNKYEKNACKWADAVTAISQDTFEYYSKFVPNAYFIPNGIDINSLSAETDTRFENQIIFAGRLSKEKGILTVLEAAKNLPEDIHLLIIGDGPEKGTVKESIKKSKNIHYLGYQSKDKTIPLIRGSKLLVQPSLAEGISATLLEAMACKTPVIATNLGGNNELFENDKTGILIEPNNSEALLKEILLLLNNSLKLGQIADNAFNHVQKYDWQNIGKKYLNLYQKLLHLET